MYFSKILMSAFLIIASQAFAQKLLDPSASGGSLSIVTASSGGSNTSVALAYSMRQLWARYGKRERAWSGQDEHGARCTKRLLMDASGRPCAQR